MLMLIFYFVSTDLYAIMLGYAEFCIVFFNICNNDKRFNIPFQKMVFICVIIFFMNEDNNGIICIMYILLYIYYVYIYI